MVRGYAVDRQSALKQGQVIDRYKPKITGPQGLLGHIWQQFPQGFTRHGEFYYVSDLRQHAEYPTNLDREVPAELVYELIRQAHFPERPSRYESVFAFRDVTDAKAFRKTAPDPSAPIWELEAADGFVADMNVVGGDVPACVMSWNAHRYWSGLPLDNSSVQPKWEILMVPPVTVMKQV
jgi:hypothetical protein